MAEESNALSEEMASTADADTLPPPAAAETERVAPVHPLDDSCFLCVSLPPKSSNPDVMSDAEFHYCFGFADGASTAMRGSGWLMCQRHKDMLRAACLERGLNWGAPDRRRVALT